MEVYTNHVILYGSDNMLPVVIVMDPDGSSEPYMIVNDGCPFLFKEFKTVSNSRVIWMPAALKGHMRIS